MILRPLLFPPSPTRAGGFIERAHAQMDGLCWRTDLQRWCLWCGLLALFLHFFFIFSLSFHTFIHSFFNKKINETNEEAKKNNKNLIYKYIFFFLIKTESLKNKGGG